ncbi:MAG: CarD family transcriptional regulator [Myxococcales bacterium]|nr:CarD family transcriptional regulator [Myxococcales bacterium]MCB9548615.1 CarD family transcriptional regulator [Myxococcales bacterium]
MVEFTVGDVAVYQGQGIGRITGVGTMRVAGTELKVYTLRMDSGAIVRIPTDKAQSVGLREVTPLAEIPAVYDILRQEGQRPKDKTWNRRYRAYSEKLRTGSVKDIAEVFRDLVFLRGTKELSFGERQMLEQARTLLVKELSLATDRAEGDVEQELETLLAHC